MIVVIFKKMVFRVDTGYASFMSYVDCMVPDVFTTITWRNTYCSNFVPINLADFVQFVIHGRDPPAKEHVAMGRPQVVRMVFGSRKKVARAQAKLNLTELAPDRGQGSQACRNCGVYGHNRATCTADVVV